MNKYPRPIFFFLALVLAFGLALNSCVEEIDRSNRYTFKGQTVASYLQDHDETFSHFLYILERGGKLSLLKAYGTYTCFAPTNQAVERFLVEQDSIWRASLLPGAKREIWTGVTSPRLEELSDSMCKVIAQTHILPKAYMTTQLEGDVVPTMNLNDRHLSLTYDVDENDRSLLYINHALIIHGDEEVENGIVHVIGTVMNPSSSTMPAVIEDMPFLTIFSEALKRTGLDLNMEKYKDETYTMGDKTTLSASGRPGCPYPPNRYFGYTAFCEPDSVFYQLDINSVDDLYRKCLEWYPDATDPDTHSPNNALWKFMAYHLLDRKLLYPRLVCYNLVFNNEGTTLYNSEFNFAKYTDRTEYYETMQGTLMKVCMPRSNDSYVSDILINYAADLTNLTAPYHSTAGKNGIPVNVRVREPSELSHYTNYVQEALNGAVHLLDHVLVYDEDVMTGHVLNGIIRMDFSALASELTNNNVRCSTGDGITFSESPEMDCEFFIPNDYCERIKTYNEDTRIYYLSPHNTWANYQGDEMWARDGYDVSFRLPHVPAGTYELRLGFGANPYRGVAQFYVDDQVTGIPCDMSILMDDPLIGYVPDWLTDDNGVANDKAMKNRGYLKGPTSFTFNNGQTSITARNGTQCVRRVITTKYLAEGDHWLRFKNVNDKPGAVDYAMLDYLEIVPLGWLRREDLSLEEKRK